MKRGVKLAFKKNALQITLEFAQNELLINWGANNILVLKP